MLNFDTKQEAVARLESAVAGYNALHRAVLEEATSLHRLRESTSREIIGAAEAYVNKLANSPKEFEKRIAEYRIEVEHFGSVVRDFIADSERASLNGALGAGASLGLGAAAMVAGPAAAMSVATTFGAASTGTATPEL